MTVDYTVTIKAHTPAELLENNWALVFAYMTLEDISVHHKISPITRKNELGG